MENDIRHNLVRLACSLFERGLTPGSSGNISVRLPDGFLVTPTNSCLGFLVAEKLTKLDKEGNYISGDKPTKELPLHFSFYKARPQTNAVVHTHSTYSTLLSCLLEHGEDVIAPITPYVVMRVGAVPLIPYTRPGSAEIIPLIEARAPKHSAILLGNHGPVVAGASLEAALFALEELEETAKLIHLAGGQKMRLLNAAQIADIKATFST
jgi:3-dehydro-4-phosphotetronate decarboxylase